MYGLNFFLLQNACIYWSSCKQKTMALSSTAEAEYKAMASATQEGGSAAQAVAN